MKTLKQNKNKNLKSTILLNKIPPDEPFLAK